MQPLENLAGDKLTRVYISMAPDGKILGGVQDENLVLRCFCRKGWAVKNKDGKWYEVAEGTLSFWQPS